MGENRERAEQAPRLDLQVAAAADSGRREAVAPPEVSNLREVGAEGTSDNKQCNHVPTDSAHMKMLSSSVFSERAGRCERPFDGTSILVCLECGRHFCSGVGSVEYPYRHSRVHAQEEEHWVAALSEDPESAFCFKCDRVMDGPRDTIRGLLAAAEADSGSSDKALSEPEGFDDNEPCNHVPTDCAHMEMLRSSLTSEHAGKCVHWKTFKGSSILVCMECGHHFCAGLGSTDCPLGHSRLHAKQQQHWVAALYDEPESAYCFKCEYVVCVNPPDDVETDGLEAGDHALELSDEARNLLGGLSNAFRSAYVHDYAIRGMPVSVECKFSSSRQHQGSVAQGQILQTVDEISEGINLGMSCGEKDSAACNAPKEPECHAGNLEAVCSCLPAEKQTDLLRAQRNQDVSIQIKMYQGLRKQIGLDHKACQFKDNRNEQRDRNGDAT